MNASLQALFGSCPEFLQALVARKEAKGMTGAVGKLAWQKQRGVTAGLRWLLEDVKRELVKVILMHSNKKVF